MDNVIVKINDDWLFKYSKFDSYVGNLSCLDARYIMSDKQTDEFKAKKSALQIRHIWFSFSLGLNIHSKWDYGCLVSYAASVARHTIIITTRPAQPDTSSTLYVGAT